MIGRSTSLRAEALKTEWSGRATVSWTRMVSLSNHEGFTI